MNVVDARSCIRRDVMLIFILALLVRLLSIIPVHGPGYMDAAYSYDIALNLAHGQGFNEPFLWNYLDNPAGLPHPSHLYWMPLPTILAWAGLKFLGESYRSAQVPFVLMAALLPLVSYWVALQVTGRRRHGWLAGLLTIFSGFYVLYWGHTDNFTPFALAGSLSLVAAWQAGRATENKRGAGRWWALGAGALVGLAHLSRADGPLLLIAIGMMWGVSLISKLTPSREMGSWRLDIGHLLWLFVGYGLVMLPWFIRNWLVTGAPLPTAGTQTMWLTTYDDLFSYGRELSLSTYLAWGWANILRSKLDALWPNVQTVVAVFGMVFLAPLACVGGWRLRRHSLFQLAAWYGALLFLAMTFIFTFPGPRGGLFHSGGALLPFMFTAAAVGLDASIEWAAAHRRGWQVATARRVFGVGMIGLAALVSGFLYYQGVVVGTRWREEPAYSDLVEWLAVRDQLGQLVMVGDPPSYWYAGGGPSVVVPNGPVETLLAVADRYGARYAVLDHNHPAPLEPLYAEHTTVSRLSPVCTLMDAMHQPVYVFQIRSSSD
jgi:4-amino-4-deoxy-L-arabinose transferase-like glycosyltransferase